MRMNKFIKKTLPSIFVVVALFIARAEKVSAQIPIEIKNPISTSDFAKLVENTLLWVLSVAGVMTIFMLVLGGIMYMTSAGDEQKVATAKKIVTWTIIGLGLILISYSIIKVLNDILT